MQRLKRASKTMGAKPDLEIFGLIAKEMGMRDFLALATGRGVRRDPQDTCADTMFRCRCSMTGGAAQTMPVNGRVPVASRPDLIQSARDTLFTSGTLGPYSIS